MCWCVLGVQIPFQEVGFILLVMFYGLYHGKSPSNHHLGSYFLELVPFASWPCKSKYMGYNPFTTVDGSEIPNNHLECIIPL